MSDRGFLILFMCLCCFGPASSFRMHIHIRTLSNVAKASSSGVKCLMAKRTRVSSSLQSERPNRSKSKNSNSYYAPGYAKGDIEILQSVFETNTFDGQMMSFDSFVGSKYLRFWPGRNSEAQEIWCRVTAGGSLESPLTLDKCSDLLHCLDEVATATEIEMEQERLSWIVEDMNHEFLEDFFESKAKKRRLSFNDFMAFENVQAEMWYNEKGLTEAKIASLWERITGSIAVGVDKDTFMKIYDAVCQCQYQL